MLERLHVRYQAHDPFALDFDPLVTVLIGPSDAGKSSLLRALRWLATNRPEGDSFVPWGGTKASAVLTLDGGRKIAAPARCFASRSARRGTPDCWSSSE